MQTNYTDSEQTKMLLELVGLPRNSADCVRVVRTGLVLFIREGMVTDDYLEKYHEDAEPCWTYGRLIEIFERCTPFTIYQFDFTGTYIERACKALMFAKDINRLDFNKLVQ